ncbi:MAG: cyclase family protein [Bacteroidota bacterium]
MEIKLTLDGNEYTCDLSNPLDISIPVRDGLQNVNCFYAPPVEFSPVLAGNFIGDTRQGGVVNFFNIKINPHGNGTHTECVGHITKERYYINECLDRYIFPATVISVWPTKNGNGDRVITKDQVEALFDGGTPALVIRTLPNDELKKEINYSGANPPYLDVEATAYLVRKGVDHLLIDLPSVDREEDEGALASHKAFWNYEGSLRTNCTISELIFVPEMIKDGIYLLNIQIASLELDVSPSKPILYALTPD